MNPMAPNPGLEELHEASAPLAMLIEKFGFTLDAVPCVAREGVAPTREK
jgi:hypothetical protein